MLSLGNESLGVNLAFLQSEPFLFFGNEKPTTFYPLSSPLLLRVTYWFFFSDDCSRVE